ncbi:hypothetical protein AYL99_07830 [Fonsecaea erecta]|uniref:Uncharacterized protein n=1 Tax=Fonsecaea erecta TaxID=1367422 RepID=A0A178ZG34_9EURO|nr:hypothetical protein AYL99_07830 [Fonsecaea erecta]OAP58740.1 hypothetical protein AYL99_07830 [Fonsecaea erecta]
MLQSNEERQRKAECYDAGTFMMIATPESFERLPQYHRSLLGDRTLCPLSPQLRTPYREAVTPCSGDLTSCGPTVHMVRTSGDIHAFLELEDEACTRPRPSPPSKDPSPRRSNLGRRGSRFSVTAVVKGKENSRLADYGARIWRELSQATAEHLASYRWK